MNHPRAIITTVAIFTKLRPLEELDYEVHEVIGKLFEDWSDERKADLYARLAEGLRPGMQFKEAEDVVSRCLRANAKECPHG